jgi:hypothetical protein
MLEKSLEETPFFRFAKDAHKMAQATRERMRNSSGNTRRGR